MKDGKNEQGTPPIQQKAPEKRFNQRGDSTSMFQLGPEPAIEGLSLPASSNKIMERIREMLDPDTWKACEPNESGVIFDNFAKNIRGCAAVTLQSRRSPEQKDTFFVVCTRKNIWLIYSTPHETLHDHYETLMNVNLKLRTILERKEDKSKKKYVSHLSAQDLRNFYATASFYRAQGPAAQKPAPAVDTLAPESQEASVSIEEIQRKIKTSALIISSQKGFSLQEFSDTIKFASTFLDEMGRTHYFIIAGEEESVYRLYINGNVAPSAGAVGFVRFRYCNDSCIMYKEGP